MKRWHVNPRVVVCIVFVAALFMAIMDSTIVNVALPTLHRQFTASDSAVDLVIVVYLVSIAVAIPVSGWIGDRWGTKRTFLSALIAFSGASFLCGVSTSLEGLIAARLLQGAAAGLLSPVGTTMLYRTFRPEERVEVSRILIIPTVIAPAMGPILGGWIVDQFSWHWVFFVNVPIGLLTFVFGFLWLEEHTEPAAGKFDLPGFLLAGFGFALFLFALTEGPSRGWLSMDILICGIGGVAMIVGFFLVELRAPEPMIQPRLLEDPLFGITNLISLFSSAGFTGILFIVPLFLQQAKGVSALTSGLTTFPEAIGVVLFTQVAAKHYPSIGPRRLMAGSLCVVSLSIAGLYFIGLDTNLWFVRGLMFVIGGGMSFVFLSMRAAAFATITSEAMGRASALFNAQNQLGSAFGVAVLSSVMTSIGPLIQVKGSTAQPNTAAYHGAFLAAAGMAITAAFLSLAVSDKAAAVTMRRDTKD